MNIKNQNGSVIITSALVMAVLAGVVYFYSNVQMLKVTKEYRRTKSMAYAHQIAANLAQQLRWSYDIAKIDSTTSPSPGLCTSYGGSPVTVGPITLCLRNGEVCTAHPGLSTIPGLQPICISPATNTLFAKVEPLRNPIQARPNNLFAKLLRQIQQAQAQGYRPLPPAAGLTTNALPAWPLCINGGDCRVRCNNEADCLSFTFCPIKQAGGVTCDDKELVTQTVGFLKD